MSTPTWPQVLSRLLSGGSLASGEAAWAMERIMEGEATPAQFGAFVAALRAKGETAGEILGLVETMRSFARRVEVDGPLVDTCGTGGDRAGTVNVSTMAALAAAGAGARVAKHGNRAASSLCGSADLFEELGVKIDLPPEGVAACIEEAGIGFCFAPIFHPSMRHAAGPRKELGVPTVFNFLGPLTNPAGARHQALGVSDPTMAPKLIEVLSRLDSVHVLVFHGTDGLDEITVTGPSAIWELREGSVSEWMFDPADLGIDRASPDSLKGGTPSENAAIAQRVLSGETGPARDVVLLNAAAALVAADLARDLAEGLEQGADSIDSGRAAAVLGRLVRVSRLMGEKDAGGSSSH
ncbi:MAG: anthranilate phosphoribosyltransferase [Actinomycetota bacterium]